jgi:hypothetical protein
MVAAAMLCGCQQSQTRTEVAPTPDLDLTVAVVQAGAVIVDPPDAVMRVQDGQQLVMAAGPQRTMARITAGPDGPAVLSIEDVGITLDANATVILGAEGGVELASGKAFVDLPDGVVFELTTSAGVFAGESAAFAVELQPDLEDASRPWRGAWIERAAAHGIYAMFGAPKMFAIVTVAEGRVRARGAGAEIEVRANHRARLRQGRRPHQPERVDRAAVARSTGWATPKGWARGKKVGWRGAGVPPGLAKHGGRPPGQGRKRGSAGQRGGRPEGKGKPPNPGGKGRAKAPKRQAKPRGGGRSNGRGRGNAGRGRGNSGRGGGGKGRGRGR